MARLPRYVIPGQPQHIIHRSNNRQAIFSTQNEVKSCPLPIPKLLPPPQFAAVLLVFIGRAGLTQTVS